MTTLATGDLFKSLSIFVAPEIRLVAPRHANRLAASPHRSDLPGLRRLASINAAVTRKADGFPSDGLASWVSSKTSVTAAGCAEASGKMLRQDHPRGYRKGVNAAAALGP
jgi:hypothetical protein